MTSTFDTVTLLTDYGHGDEFVGVLHSVIRQMSPDARVIDLCHDIPPFDIRAASLMLARSVQYLTPGVVLGAIDPAVGSERRGVAIEVAGGRAVFVGPDNGLFAAAVGLIGGSERAVELTNVDLHLDRVGTTFDGRDVFAPVAAHLCNGVPLDDLGDPVDPATLMPGLMPLSRTEGDEIVAEVLWVDRYGNCQLNVDPESLDGDRCVVEAGGRRHAATRVRSYGEIGPGRLGALVDANGLLSIVADRASAAEAIGVVDGDEVRLRLAAEDDHVDPVVTSVELTRPSEV